MKTCLFLACGGARARLPRRFSALQLVVGNIVQAGSAGSMERFGLRCIGNAPFPAPAGTEAIPMPGGDFETAGKNPPGWGVYGGAIVAAADAPQGKAYLRVKATKGNALRSPITPAPPGRPYFLSFWLKNPSENWRRGSLARARATVTFTSDERTPSFGADYPGIPATGDQWKRVGIYFWMPAPCKTIQFHIDPREERPEDQFIGVDDIQARARLPRRRT